MWDTSFQEPTRDEVISFKRLWEESFKTHCEGDVCQIDRPSSVTEREFLIDMRRKYPYIPEVPIALAIGMNEGESINGETRAALAAAGELLLQEWGMLTIKDEAISLKTVLRRIKAISNKQ